MDLITEIFALLAIITGVVSSFAYYFQVFKILKTHSAKDLSITTFSIWGITNLIWVVYGILIRNVPIIMTDGVSFVGAVMVILLWGRYRK